MKNKIVKLLILTLLVTLSSCKKFLEIPPPETEVELSKIFDSDQTALAATLGLYSRVANDVSAFCNGSITIYSALSADETFNTGVNTNDDAFRTNTLLSSNSVLLSSMWRNAYLYIYHTNAVIEGLEQSASVSRTVKDQLTGEMLYLRALHHFYLVNLFGDVPLMTSTNYLVNANMARTQASIVWDQITHDLRQASTLITDNTNLDNTRISRAACQGLLARVYLYRGLWKEAESEASKVIGTSRFALESLNNVFLIGSKEVLFSWARATGNTVEGSKFLPTSTTARPPYALQPGLMSTFENGDDRKTSWIKSNTVSGTIYNYPNKYKVRAASPITERCAVQRLAEIYLIRAEARTNQNDLSNAIDDLDMIRSRAGLTRLKLSNPTISREELLKAIYRERQVELFAEWGHRWLDLKRSGQANTILGQIKGSNWQTTDILYPLPINELQTNPNLTQNLGYE